MEYQSLKKLKRMDLLEMLIAQVEENERLLEKMEQLHFQLERQKTLSPRETGASGSAASTQVSSRAMGRSQGFAGSAGYAGSAGLMGSAGSAGSMPGGSAASAPSPGSVSYVGSMTSAGSARAMASKSSAGSAGAMASKSSAGSSTSTCLTGSAGSLRSDSRMKISRGFAAGSQASLSSAAPHTAGSPYQSASYASAAQSDPYAPESPYYASSAKITEAAPQQKTLSQKSFRPEKMDPYAPFASPEKAQDFSSDGRSFAASDASSAQASQTASNRSAAQSDPYASESPYYVAAQPAPYAEVREAYALGHMSQPDRTREELNHPDRLREELYGRQPLSFGEKDGSGVLPSFLREMPWDEQEDFSRSRVQLSREAQDARPDAPLHQQNVVPLKPSQVGTRTENFASASSAASVAAGAGTPAARQVLSGEYVSSGASADTLAATPFNAYVGERQGRVRPLPFAADPGNAAADKVNRSHA